MSKQNLDKKKQEKRTEQEFLDNFNSITEKSTPENQNQVHNVKREGMNPTNQKR